MKPRYVYISLQCSHHINMISLHLTQQSKLHDKEGKVVALLIYADKSKLSSFGTAKAYPVIMRILNIDSAVRNGKGVGAGRVVGWLPVVRMYVSPSLQVTH